MRLILHRSGLSDTTVRNSTITGMGCLCLPLNIMFIFYRDFNSVCNNASILSLSFHFLPSARAWVYHAEDDCPCGGHTVTVFTHTYLVTLMYVTSKSSYHRYIYKINVITLCVALFTMLVTISIAAWDPSIVNADEVDDPSLCTRLKE